MMFMCTSRFEIEDSHRALINEYLSHEEIQANQEEKDTTNTHHFEPISDDDEGSDTHEEVEDEDGTVQPLVEQAQSQQRQRTQLELEVEEQEDDANGEPDLPNTQRHSGRVRKRSSKLDGYEIESDKRRRTLS
jgi:hypothetical protein